MTDSPLPNNVDAEESVLSAALARREDLEEALGFLKPEHFYRTAHEIIFIISRLVESLKRSAARPTSPG